MKYRAEIDGLRALAVMPVILFHAGFETFRGGFVGVDVFFVISGYLITTILINDIEQKRFSILNFYERRARRILPALFFVMVVCIPFAWIWMLPSQMKDFSQSIIAVSLFVSNILFWKETDYFGVNAEEKPLLHTWSLAVEEQYYLLFPIFLILLWRFGKNRVFWIIFIIALFSLILSEWGWRNKPNANFYLAPTRAWEILAGSITAFILQARGVKKNNVLAFLGLVGIIFSIFAYDASTPFPSIYTLVPVIGAMLIVLYAHKNTITAKLLSTKAFVGIGLISYSAYLWHQPLFAFARIRSLVSPSDFLMVLLSLSSIALAYFSWKYVEMPFRKVNALQRKHIFMISFLFLIVFLTFGFVGHIKSGIPSRLDSKIIDLVEIHSIETKLRDDGGCNRRENETEILACLFGSKHNLKVALVGDSHASSLVSALNEIGLDNNIGFVRHTKNECPFVRNFQSGTFGNCFEFVDGVLSWLEENNSIEKVIISQRLQFYIKEPNSLNTVGGNEVFGNNLYGTIETLRESFEVRKKHILSEFKETIKLLASKNHQLDIILISPIPVHEVHVPHQLAKSLIYLGNDSAVGPLPLKRYYYNNKDVFGVLDELNNLDNVVVYRLDEYLCSSKSCRSVLGSIPLYYDNNHLTKEGALIALKSISDLLDD